MLVGAWLFFQDRHQPEAEPVQDENENARPCPPAGYRMPSARAARLSAPVINTAGNLTVTLPFARLLSPSATNYPGSMRALRELPAELSSAQVETLRDALAVPYDPRMPGTLLEFNGVKNAAADLLLQQPAFPPSLLFDFAAMFEDPSQDPVWRDYCLQMLVTGWLGLSGRDGLDVSAARERAVTVLTEAAETRDNTWPGTALLGLNTLLSADPSAVPRDGFVCWKRASTSPRRPNTRRTRSTRNSSTCTGTRSPVRCAIAWSRSRTRTAGRSIRSSSRW